jgi:hypothetical protein
MQYCQNCKKFMLFEHALITKHIDRHKWLRGISSVDDAVCNFVESYAWVIRESFCGSCDKRSTCDIYADKLNQQPPLFVELFKNVDKLSDSDLTDIFAYVNNKIKRPS